MRNFRLIFLLLVVLPSTLWAKDHKWQEGKVTRTIGTIPQRGQYWIRGTDTTYVIHNYANGSMVQWWLHLTLGGPVQVYSDGKNLHVVDNQGKERKCQILQEMVNAAADSYLAKEAAKTPEQLAAEQAQRDNFQLQQEALRLQQARDRAAVLENSPKVEVAPVIPIKQPIRCTSQTSGDSTYTTCNQ